MEKVVEKRIGINVWRVLWGIYTDAYWILVCIPSFDSSFKNNLFGKMDGLKDKRNLYSLHGWMTL